MDAYTSFGSRGASCGNPSRASGCPGSVKFKDYAGMAVTRRSDRRRIAGIFARLAWPLAAQVSGKSKGQERVYDLPTDEEGQEAVPHRGMRLVALADERSLPSPISARSVTRNEVPEPIGRSTFSRSPVTPR